MFDGVVRAFLMPTVAGATGGVIRDAPIERAGLEFWRDLGHRIHMGFTLLLIKDLIRSAIAEPQRSPADWIMTVNDQHDPFSPRE
jgi:hypothetical protein